MIKEVKMYIPKGYDRVDSDRLHPSNCAMPSLYDFEHARYISLSATWLLGDKANRALRNEMNFVIPRNEVHNNRGMHQEDVWLTYGE